MAAFCRPRTSCVQGNSALFGGGLYFAESGTAVNDATLTNCTVQGNSAQVGSYGDGGGLYIAGGAVTLKGDTVQHNSANTYGNGGGIYILSGATVHLDSFTVANTINNMAYVDPNIDGTYILNP